jgi:hypothetical protein
MMRSARRLATTHSRSVDMLGAVGVKRFVQMQESSYYGLKLEQVRVGGAITYLAPKSGANGRFPPGGAIRDSSRSSTALDPAPTAQTDPRPSLPPRRRAFLAPRLFRNNVSPQ